jgi:hypothetical protein
MKNLYKIVVGVMIFGSIGIFVLFEILNAEGVSNGEPSIKQQQQLNNVNSTGSSLQNSQNTSKDINNGTDFDEGD